MPQTTRNLGEVDAVRDINLLWLPFFWAATGTMLALALVVLVLAGLCTWVTAPFR